MAEITGGELKYIASIDVSQLKDQLKDAQGNLKGFSEIAELTGEKLDNALKGTATASLKEISTEVGKTGESLKKANDIKIDFGLTKENISIQKQVIADIKKNIEDIEKRAKDIAPGMAQATLLGEIGPLKNELASEEKALISLQTELGKTEAKHISLITARNSALDVMRKLTFENKQGTDEYKEAEKAVVQYTQAIDQTNAKAKLLSSGGFAGMVQGLSLITGIFATGQSVMGFFAGENENLNRIMLKSQALLAAAVSLQQIHNAITTNGVLGVTSLATAKNFLTAANTRLAVSLGISNIAAAALMATLTLGLSVAIVGAIYLWDKYSDAQAKVQEAQKKTSEALANEVSSMLVSYYSLQQQWNSLGNDLKAKEKFITDNKNAFNELGTEVDNVSDAEKILKGQTDDFIKMMMLRAEAAANAQLAVEDFKESLKMRAEATEDLSNPSNWQQIKYTVKGIFGNSVEDEINDAYSGSEQKKKSALDRIKKQNELLKQADEFNFKAVRGSAKSSTSKSSTTKTPKSAADEFLPPGSIAEIQKRLSQIDEALSKATDSTKIEALKNKRISTAAELAEAVKKIEIKSLEDRAAEQEKYRVAYAVIAENQGKDEADKLYGPLMAGSQSYYGFLDAEREKLLQKQQNSILTDQDKEDLVFLTQKLDEMEGKKNAFQSFTDDIDEALVKIPTLAGQIEFLQKKATEQFDKKGNKSFDDGEQKYLKEQEDQRLKQLKDNYKSFINEHKNYEEQKKAITDKYAELRKQAQTNEDRKKIDKAEKSDVSQLELGFLKESDDWKMAFGDVELFTQNTIQRILDNLIKYRNEKKDALQPTEERELANAISRLQDAANKNPFIKVIQGLKEMKAARIEVIKAEKEYREILASNGGNDKSDEAVAAYKKLTKAERDAADAKKAFISGVADAKGVFNAVSEGVLELGDAFGGMSDATKDAITDITAIGNAALDFATSIATGDVAGLIKSGVKLITSIFSALNGDKKKERQIKKQAAQLKELEIAYNDLAEAADRAFGAQKYDGQRDLIKNLEQQKVVLEGLLATESDKKKADDEKIAGYQSQIQSINSSIASIKDGILKDVLQTDVVDAAAKVGDALVDAFSRGENSVKSLQNAANDMIKNLLKNQLNIALQNKLKPILDKILKDAGFNQDGTGSFTGLSPDQIKAFKEQVVNAGQSMQGFLDAYSEIFQGIDGNEQGLKGDIKGITEKTAGALEAQINAIRIYQVEALNIQKANQLNFVKCLQNLVLIEFNTRSLIPMQKDIAEMNAKMKKNLVGFP